MKNSSSPLPLPAAFSSLPSFSARSWKFGEFFGERKPKTKVVKNCLGMFFPLEFVTFSGELGRKYRTYLFYGNEHRPLLNVISWSNFRVDLLRSSDFMTIFFDGEFCLCFQNPFFASEFLLIIFLRNALFVGAPSQKK